MSGVPGGHWEGASADWIDWARAPGHDAFWAYRDALRSFIPPPGGILTVSIVHPFTDRGRFRGEEPGAPFTVTGSYFGREHFHQRVTEGSHSMTFNGWSHSLQDYMAALAAAGLAITGLREPLPDVDRASDMSSWTRLPLFLWINARPLS